MSRVGYILGVHRPGFKGAALALALHLSCVPSVEDPNPRGAIRVLTSPSSGTLGEAFTTRDGWTLHIDTVVVLALVGGKGTAETVGSSTMHLFRAKLPQEFVIVRIDAGSGWATLGLTSSSVGAGATLAELNRDATPEEVARFAELADDVDPNPPPDDPSTPDLDESASVPPSVGPSILIVGRAEKAGRSILFDFAIQGAYHDISFPVTVAPDVANDVRVTLAVEQLFNGSAQCRADGPESVDLVFDDVAAADADGDSVLTAAELRAVDLSVPGARSIASTLGHRACRIFSPH